MMNGNMDYIDKIEKALAQVFCRKPVPSPQEGWYRAVMKQIQLVPLRETLPYLIMERVAYRVAWATAAAAAALVLIELTIMPSEIKLADEMQAGGTISEWTINAGGE